jgi:hypothetical protein
LSEFDSCRKKPFECSTGDDSRQGASGAYGQKFCGSSGHDDLVRVHVSEAAGSSGNDERPAVDRYDFVAVECIKFDDVATLCAQTICFSSTGSRPPADDRGIDMDVLDRCVFGRPTIGCWRSKQRWCADCRMTSHDHSRLCRHLTGPDKGDAVDLSDTVATVTAQAKRATVAGVLTVANCGKGDRVAVVE